MTNKKLVEFAKGSTIETVWGEASNPKAAPDVLDLALGQIVGNFSASEQRPAGTFEGRMRQAVSRASAVAGETEQPLAERVSPERRADVEFLTEHLSFIDDLKRDGLMSDADYVVEREDTEAELAKITTEAN